MTPATPVDSVKPVLVPQARRRVVALPPVRRSSILAPVASAEDRVTIVAFSSQVSVVQDYATDRTALKSALGTLNATRETLLYDAVAQTARREAGQSERRKALIILQPDFFILERIDFAELAGQIPSQRINPPALLHILDNDRQIRPMAKHGTRTRPRRAIVSPITSRALTAVSARET